VQAQEKTSGQRKSNREMQPPTKRQRLSLSKSKEAISEETYLEDEKVEEEWSQQSNFTMQANSLISEDDSSPENDPSNRRGGDNSSQNLNKQLLKEFDAAIQQMERTPLDPVQYGAFKVANFIEHNPVNPVFIKREKARLPYSVFKPHAPEVHFLKSIFSSRPPTAFFLYPSYVHIDRNTDRVKKYRQEEVDFLCMAFKISDTTHIYNAVVNSCKHAGFNMLEGANNFFNLQWTGYITANDIKSLNKYQKTNHFPGSSQLGRKDLLWKNMHRLMMKFPTDCQISPMSYILSEDFELFQSERERDPAQLWILKPVASSCGRGIKVVTGTAKINKKEGILACKYVHNPHLINGLKYDLRVYVLVTNFNPLRIYIYNDGLVRFATEKYSNDPNSLSKRFIHLTNFSVNKKSAKFVKNNDSKARATAEEDSSDDNNGA